MRMVLTSILPIALVAGVLASAAGAAAAQCSADSAHRRVALLELYTSEGCDSCPPADRWVSALPGRGLGTEQVVTLGLHVDYWNYLGWSDPFARSEFSARQRAANHRNKARVVYTPQLMLNGKDYRRDAHADGLAQRVASINREAPQARISLSLAAAQPAELIMQGTASVSDPARQPDAAAYVALYENNLVTAVAAGENRGKQLRHDFVVRELSGPFPLGPGGKAALDRRYRLDPRWKPADLHVAAFVQSERTGDVLQALALRYCGNR
jgi:hypothetical protein